MNCDCIQKLNERLKEKNLKLADSNFAMTWPECSRRFIAATQWIDKARIPKGKSKRCPLLFASHCPFCGLPATEPKAISTDSLQPPDSEGAKAASTPSDSASGKGEDRSPAPSLK